MLEQLERTSKDHKQLTHGWDKRETDLTSALKRTKIGVEVLERLITAVVDRTTDRSGNEEAYVYKALDLQLAECCCGGGGG